MVGGGADLFEPLSARLDPYTAGLLDGWEHRAFLSTRPIGAWAERELALLDSGLAIGTASRAGLRALGEHVAGGHPEHARLLDGILIDRASPPAAPEAVSRVSLAALLDALRTRLQSALAHEAPAAARAALGEALRLLDDPSAVARALDLITRAWRFPGAEALDCPRLLAELREALRADETRPAKSAPRVARGRTRVFFGPRVGGRPTG